MTTKAKKGIVDKIVKAVKPAAKVKARTANARTAPEIKTTASGQKYVERKLINAPVKGKK
jgi:hypothetical protein